MLQERALPPSARPPRLEARALERGGGTFSPRLLGTYPKHSRVCSDPQVAGEPEGASVARPEIAAVATPVRRERRPPPPAPAEPAAPEDGTLASIKAARAAEAAAAREALKKEEADRARWEARIAAENAAARFAKLRQRA